MTNIITLPNTEKHLPCEYFTRFNVRWPLAASIHHEVL